MNGEMDLFSGDPWDDAPSPEIINIMDAIGIYPILEAERNLDSEDADSNQSTTLDESDTDEEVLRNLRECVQYAQTHYEDDGQLSGHPESESPNKEESDEEGSASVTHAAENDICEAQYDQPHDGHDQASGDPLQILHSSSDVISDIPGHSSALIGETENSAIEKLQEGRKRKRENDGEPSKRQCRETTEVESTGTVSSCAFSSPNRSTIDGEHSNT
ncbi:uncharacterized protein LOC122265798 isoform X2 [Penaeus japonicus]|uniref:uncharacterized protein LOC122265798 isoform X1 n=1 Tax=Penaeus japonicus TaxID=27405 RepID=UPI001C70FE6A|nr:uncharacterized protein LOC122265798 isoform X1 [Penaeus japonicus]XP_042891160.1 uncharacterized protein LOC122265798 isoform X2 [Penaeus japonicus]